MTNQIDNLYQDLSHPVQQNAGAKGLHVKVAAHYVDFISPDARVIRIGLRHFVYPNDIVDSFEHYFKAVQPILMQGGMQLDDYSQPKYHDVVGYDPHPVYFSSFSEPITTTEQYLDFADLQPGHAVLDLGAYAGLTSIMFKERVGSSGRVVAVDADAFNIVSIEKNLKFYMSVTGNDIRLLCGAVWNHTDGLSFSAEGNMGAGVSSIIGSRSGETIQVPSFTLSALMAQTQTTRVDFIKCDVEGAEQVVFQDAAFFAQHRPRIIIETHIVAGIETTDKCIRDLEQYGYTCKRIYQIGVTLPLLECHPPSV